MLYVTQRMPQFGRTNNEKLEIEYRSKLQVQPYTISFERVLAPRFEQCGLDILRILF